MHYLPTPPPPPSHIRAHGPLFHVCGQNPPTTYILGWICMCRLDLRGDAESTCPPPRFNIFPPLFLSRLMVGTPHYKHLEVHFRIMVRCPGGCIILLPLPPPAFTFSCPPPCLSGFQAKSSHHLQFWSGFACVGLICGGNAKSTCPPPRFNISPPRLLSRLRGESPRYTPRPPIVRGCSNRSGV